MVFGRIGGGDAERRGLVIADGDAGGRRDDGQGGTVRIGERGQMGAGIAEVSARAGLDTIVHEIDAASAERGRNRLIGSFDKAVARGRMTEEERDAKQLENQNLLLFWNKHLPFYGQLSHKQFDRSILSTLEFENTIYSLQGAMEGILKNQQNEMDKVRKLIDKIIELSDTKRKRK